MWQWLELQEEVRVRELQAGEGEVEVRRSAFESMRQWVELEADHRTCLFECFRAMILGRGDEEAQMQVDNSMDVHAEMPFRIGWSLSYLAREEEILMRDEEILMREEQISGEESEQESNVEEAR